MDRDKISNLYKGHSIDAFYQVSVHLAEGFQRRRLKCEMLTDDGRQVKAKAELALNNNHSFTQSLLSSKRAMVLQELSENYITLTYGDYNVLCNSA